MDWKPETDITMDYAVHDHQDERTTAVITQLTELLNLVSNHLGSPIDFTDKPVTKKPTSKKVPMKGSNETDKTTLSNKTIPGLAISQAKPKVTKQILLIISQEILQVLQYLKNILMKNRILNKILNLLNPKVK